MKFRVVNAYNLKGEYLFTFNKLGVNKGGSSFPLDVAYDPQKRHIFIVSNTPSKLMEFSPTGLLIAEYPLEFYPSSMEVKSGNEYIFDVNFNFNSVSRTNNIIVTDSTLEIRDRFLTYDSVIESTASPLDMGGLFKPNDSSLYFLPAYSNLVLAYRDKDFSSIFNIHFPTQSENDPQAVIRENVNEMNYEICGYFFKNDSYIGINYSDKKNKEIYATFYNYHNGKLYRSAFFNPNDINSFAGYIFQSGNKIFLLVNVDRFYQRIEKHNKSKRSNVLYNKIISEFNDKGFDKNSVAIITLEIAQ